MARAKGGGGRTDIFGCSFVRHKDREGRVGARSVGGWVARPPVEGLWTAPRSYCARCCDGRPARQHFWEAVAGKLEMSRHQVKLHFLRSILRYSTLCAPLLSIARWRCASGWHFDAPCMKAHSRVPYPETALNQQVQRVAAVQPMNFLQQQTGGLRVCATRTAQTTPGTGRPATCSCEL